MWIEKIIGQTLGFDHVSAKEKKDLETTGMSGDLRSTKSEAEALIAVH